MTASLDFEKFRKHQAVMIAGATESEREAAKVRATKIAAKAGMSLVQATEAFLAQIPLSPARAMVPIEDLFPEEPKQPFLWAPGEACSIEHAAGVFGYSGKRMRDLAKAYGIVVTAPGVAKMWTCLAAVSMVLSSDFTALEMLQQDEREHPRVKRHFKHAAEREAAYLVLDRLKSAREHHASSRAPISTNVQSP